MKRKLSILLLIILLLGGGYFLFEAIKIEVKAKVGQVLLKYAWNISLKDNKPNKPWSRIDAMPIFKLEIPKHGISQVILDESSGEALSWSPTFHQETYLPYKKKITAISGHRDSHFTYIKDLQIGDIIKLQDLNRNWYTYKIEEFLIVNVKDGVSINHNNRLLLITCYPFDAILSGTPLRYIVSAKNVDNVKS